MAGEEKILVDGSGMILGRLCSRVAKLLLQGKLVSVVNAGQIVISGKKRMIMDERLDTLKMASIVHPRHGPFHPRTPDRIVTRTVRGMLPMRKTKGADALRRLRVYDSVPNRFKDTPAIELDAKASKPLALYLTVADIADRIGRRQTG